MILDYPLMLSLEKQYMCLKLSTTCQLARLYPILKDNDMALITHVLVTWL